MRSIAQKTPSMPASSTRNQNQYSFTRSSMLKEKMSETRVNSVVSSISGSDSPSTPR